MLVRTSHIGTPSMGPYLRRCCPWGIPAGLARARAGCHHGRLVMYNVVYEADQHLSG
jgi:hypothetical protein